MARFLGFVRGQRGPATRLGSASSGLAISANGWNGGVNVNLYVDKEGRDCASIFLTDGSGHTGEPQIFLFNGPIGADHRKMLNIAERWAEEGEAKP